MARLPLWGLVEKREQVAAALDVPIGDTVVDLDGLVRVEVRRPLTTGDMEAMAAKLAAKAPDIRVRVFAEGKVVEPPALDGKGPAALPETRKGAP